jgi:hypothetical protein
MILMNLLENCFKFQRWYTCAISYQLSVYW